MMRFLAIVLLSILAAIAYGIAHDQITARVCLEYFTVGHPAILPPELFDSPTWQGILWGVIATWWVGLILGVPLAVAACPAGRPKRSVRSLARPIGRLLGVMAVVALASGIIGFVLARLGVVSLVEPIASKVPAERHARYLAALWAHLASYASGLIGGIVTIALVWRSRRPVEQHTVIHEQTTTRLPD
ncbi:hypothetical protein AB1L88_22455 [Tautonia sp. JC769]|uniref:hypothetical protein n=1 Tax=Tautonia sp. JC769 TaxID=3232135 RepID=UPI003457A30D